MNPYPGPRTKVILLEKCLFSMNFEFYQFGLLIRLPLCVKKSIDKKQFDKKL